ncbi:hypothetical protein N9933_01190 [bacterium]|nr:hypothetical protein [bacterium]
MVKETRKKIFIASLIRQINIMLVRGDDISAGHLKLLLHLCKYAIYAEKQVLAGSTTHGAQVVALDAMIKDLMDKCPEICTFREKYKMTHTTIGKASYSYFISGRA